MRTRVFVVFFPEKFFLWGQNDVLLGEADHLGILLSKLLCQVVFQVVLVDEIWARKSKKMC